MGSPARTVCRALKKAGMKAEVKRKRPMLTKRHRRERMDFSLAHKNWTVDDWINMTPCTQMA